MHLLMDFYWPQPLIDGSPCVGSAQDTLTYMLHCSVNTLSFNRLASKQGTLGKVGPTNRQPIFALPAVGFTAGVGILKAAKH